MTTSDVRQKMRLAVFASSGGTNFQAILDATAAGTLPARVVLCLSNKAGAGALERARLRGIDTAVLDARDFDDETAYVLAMRDALDRHGVNFIALAGYLRKVPADIVRAFRERIVNIHPALLPAFGGEGMYGRRVHEAVLQSGVRWSGATVHLVDEDYDTGPIVLQQPVPVRQDDTPQTLAARVLAVEHHLYPEALRLFAEGRISVQGRRVLIHEDAPLSSG